MPTPQNYPQQPRQTYYQQQNVYVEPAPPKDNNRRNLIAAIGGILAIIVSLITIFQFIHGPSTPTTGEPTAVIPTSNISSASTSGAKPQAAVRIVPNSVSFIGGETKEVGAQCNNGEQLVGGGFNSDSYVNVYQSYPNNSATWSVIAYNYGSNTPVQLNVYAICVDANFSLGMQIKSSDPNPAPFSNGVNQTSATCPAGTVLTGGGEQVFTPSTNAPPSVLFDSFPANNAWNVGASTGNQTTYLHAYVLCASSHFSLAEIASSQPYTVTQTNTFQISCTNGEILTAGGFHSDSSDQRFKPAASFPSSSDWAVTARYASGNGTPAPSVTLYAICATYQ